MSSDAILLDSYDAGLSSIVMEIAAEQSPQIHGISSSSSQDDPTKISWLGLDNGECNDFLTCQKMPLRPDTPSVLQPQPPSMSPPFPGEGALPSQQFQGWGMTTMAPIGGLGMPVLPPHGLIGPMPPLMMMPAPAGMMGGMMPPMMTSAPSPPPPMSSFVTGAHYAGSSTPGSTMPLMFPAVNPTAKQPSSSLPPRAQFSREGGPVLGIPIIDFVHQWQQQQQAMATPYQACWQPPISQPCPPPKLPGLPPAAAMPVMPPGIPQMPSPPFHQLSVPAPALAAPPISMAPSILAHHPSASSLESPQLAYQVNAEAFEECESSDDEDGSLYDSEGDGTAGGKRGQQDAASKRRKSRESKRGQECKNCGTKSTPFWRKDKSDGKPLCNACGLYHAKNDAPRPKLLWRADEGGVMAMPPGSPMVGAGPSSIMHNSHADAGNSVGGGNSSGSTAGTTQAQVSATTAQFHMATSAGRMFGGVLPSSIGAFIPPTFDASKPVPEKKCTD